MLVQGGIPGEEGCSCAKCISFLASQLLNQEAADVGTALQWLHVLMGLDPEGIFYLNVVRELFHSFTVTDWEHFVGVQGLVRLVFLVAINLYNSDRVGFGQWMLRGGSITSHLLLYLILSDSSIDLRVSIPCSADAFLSAAVNCRKKPE